MQAAVAAAGRRRCLPVQVRVVAQRSISDWCVHLRTSSLAYICRCPRGREDTRRHRARARDKTSGENPPSGPHHCSFSNSHYFLVMGFKFRGRRGREGCLPLPQLGKYARTKSRYSRRTLFDLLTHSSRRYFPESCFFVVAICLPDRPSAVPSFMDLVSCVRCRI